MCIYANRSLGLWFREQTIYSQTMLAALITHAAVLHGAVQWRLGVSAPVGPAPEERNPQIMKLRAYVGHHTYQPVLPIKR